MQVPRTDFTAAQRGTLSALARARLRPPTTGEDRMSVQSLPELLIHELGDLLFAERTITKALPKMIREVSGPEMKARLEQHLTETEQQIGNLELAFAALGERAKAERCPGILGIIKEHDEFK